MQRSILRLLSFGNSWMDIKLGLRMLVKYPGLTLVGVLGIAVAVAIAAGAFSVGFTLLNPSLPLAEGDRIVAIQNWDTAANNADRRIAHDFMVWRDELRSIEGIGAFRQVSRNLIAPGAQPETVRVAEMSAAGFSIARVSPVMGRYFVADDEIEGASPVVVIGYDAWQRRFAADSRMVGRAIQLGDVTYTVIGVMPEGFAFPIDHSYWIPLRLRSRQVPRSGASLYVFGRLRPGVTRALAQSELTIVGQRAAAALPATHARLRPQVVPYTYLFSYLADPANRLGLQVMQFLVAALLVVVCVNVAILVYARTATRQGEIAVRTALGASRGRIVGQLFLEALVLSGVAACAGLGIAAIALRRAEAALLQIAGTLPFWMDLKLSPGTVMYAVAMAVLAAAIVGGVPALKATGRLQTGLQNLSAGGGTRMRLGRTWTVLIVAQVAFAVALLPASAYTAWHSIRAGAADPGFAAEQFLTAQLVMERTAAPGTAGDRPSTGGFPERHAELQRRLAAEPALSAATFALDVPGSEPTAWIEVDGLPMPAHPSGGNVAAGKSTGHEAQFGLVDVDFFAVLDVPLLTGRTFQAGDTHAKANAVLVNRAFVQTLVEDGEALGRRVRYVGVSTGRSVGRRVRYGTGRGAPADHVELGRWYEIVGVVGDVPAGAIGSESPRPKLYHPATPGQVHPVNLALRVRAGAPAGFAGRLREIAADVDPNLQLRGVAGMDETLRKEQGIMRLLAGLLLTVTISVVLLAAAGVYAMMSFAVSQRRKEIGIRAALGADARHILRSIFSRALGQLAIGAGIGLVAAVLLEVLMEGETLRGNGAVVLPLVMAFTLVVGLLAALGPARRGLRIQPTEALRDE
jgi:putative ABC transport system permease protein